MLVCVALFALGGAVLWGLFQAPRNRPPASPAVPWGAPARALRFVSLDFGDQSRVNDALAQQVRALAPDYVLVQDIRFEDVLPLAAALGMEKSFHPSLFQRADPRSKDAPGDLVLSIHPLYDAARIDLDPDASRADAHGVRAVSAVDGVRFVVASGVGATDGARRALDTERRQSGSPPTVLATGFIRQRRGERQYAGDLLPTVAPMQEAEDDRGRLIRVAGIYADPSWLMAKGSSPPGADGKGLVLEVELKGSPPAATGAGTKPSR
jgi:hypothetical protein